MPSASMLAVKKLRDGCRGEKGNPADVYSYSVIALILLLFSGTAFDRKRKGAEAVFREGEKCTI